MSATTNQSSKRNDPFIKLGFSFLLIGALCFLVLSRIYFISPIAVLLSPTIFLIGISLLLTGLLTFHRSKVTRTLVLVLLILLLGLNTRIPSVVEDLLRHETINHIDKKMTLAIGDAIFIDSNVSNISARHFSYAGAQPRCNEGFCVQIQGYSPPIRGVSHFYWSEKPIESIQSFGFIEASQPPQGGPILKIRAFDSAYRLNLHLELIDKQGLKVGSEDRIYRNGFPLESPDSNGFNNISHSFLWSIEYLIHGNFVSTFVAGRFGYSKSMPVGHFLNASIDRYTEQDDPKLTQYLSPIVTQDIQLDHPYSSDDKNQWTALFIDQKRMEACKSIVSIRNPNAKDFTVGDEMADVFQSRVPYKFVNGKTGNERLLALGYPWDKMVCEDNYLYYFPRTHNYKIYEIYKYKSDGTQIYHISFNIPDSGYGLVGVISPPSLKEANGNLTFDYLDIKDNGPSNTVNRVRKMQLSPKY